MARFVPKIFVDLFSDMMTMVQHDLNNKGYFNNIQQPYFDYGTFEKLRHNYLDAASASTEVTPIVYLIQPFTEKSSDNMAVLYEAEVSLFIVSQSAPNLNINDRYSDVFKPTLYPIYESLMNNIKDYKGFMFGLGNIDHNKQDYPDWGKSENNFINDSLDAIHITNINIPVSKTNC